MIVIVDMVDVRDSPMPPQDSEIHDACESRHSATDDSDDNGRLNCGRLLAFQETSIAARSNPNILWVGVFERMPSVANKICSSLKRHWKKRTTAWAKTCRCYPQGYQCFANVANVAPKA